MPTSDHEYFSGDEDPNSPTVQRWNRIKAELDSQVPTNREELKMKLKQKLLLEETRRLSRYGQQSKLEQLQNQARERAEEELARKAEEEAKKEKKREKNRKRRQAYREKMKIKEEQNEENGIEADTEN